VLDTSVANVSLSHIAGSLSATLDESTWVLTSYLVANAVVLPMSGWFSSLLGRKRFYLMCVFIFTTSSLLCALAPSLGWLIFFRILQGLGGGGLQPTSQSILMESFPPEKRGQAMAMFGIGVIFAPIIGPVLGGWLTDNFSWHWIFLINLPVGILSIVLTSAILQDPPYLKRLSLKDGARIDFMGFGLVVLGLASLEIVLDEGQRNDWFSSPFIVTFAILAVVGLVAMVLWELRQEHPVVDLRLLKDRTFASSTVLLFMLGFVLYGSTFLIPTFLQTMVGFDATTSGLVMTPGGFVILVSMPIVGALVRKVDTRLMVAYGLIMTGIGLHIMSTWDLGTGYWDAALARVVQSMGLGCLFIPISVMAYSTLSKVMANQAAGLMNLFRNIGGSVGIAILNTILSRRTQFHQVQLVSHLSAGSPIPQAYAAKVGQALVAKGYSAADAAQKGWGLIWSQTLRQSRY
ncbi:MAG TPA: DHA2 family efflux MFS transporter permease subunit, partial [Holophaga sp.]|nr:DHA2 family efflux MFS transporter permease subunit [Holophaga sp.]